MRCGLPPLAARAMRARALPLAQSPTSSDVRPNHLLQRENLPERQLRD